MFVNIPMRIRQNAQSVLVQVRKVSAMRCGAWGLPIKKTLRHPRASEGARQAFRARLEDYKAQGREVVFIDESGFAHDMPRLYGYAASGQRAYGTQNWQARGRTNVIGALIGKALLTVGLFKTNINADAFYEWTTQDLLPKLPPQSVIVMDNATFHIRADIRAAIINADHTLDYLPTYSPDLNPIEKKWAQLKKLRRKIQCSIPELFNIESIYLA
jgi:transposase